MNISFKLMLAVGILLVATVVMGFEIPALNSHVNDYAQVLSPEATLKICSGGGGDSCGGGSDGGF